MNIYLPRLISDVLRISSQKKVKAFDKNQSINEICIDWRADVPQTAGRYCVPNSLISALSGVNFPTSSFAV